MPALVSPSAVALQQAVEKLVEQHGWHLSGVDWDGYQVRVMVRCPHNQNGVFWTDHPPGDVPPDVVAQMLFVPLRARCENEHQHLPAADMLSTKEWWTPAAPAAAPQPSAGVAFAELVALVPALNTAAVCPACDGRMSSGVRLSSVITHLNDQHEWTRERIADWLDTLDVDLTVTAASKGD